MENCTYSRKDIRGAWRACWLAGLLIAALLALSLTAVAEAQAAVQTTSTGFRYGDAAYNKTASRYPDIIPSVCQYSTAR